MVCATRFAACRDELFRDRVAISRNNSKRELGLREKCSSDPKSFLLAPAISPAFDELGGHRESLFGPEERVLFWVFKDWVREAPICANKVVSGEVNVSLLAEPESGAQDAVRIAAFGET
jgi:hypothetical protein